MSVNAISGSPFGSLDSLRRQAQEIGDRVKRASDARKDEQAKTGLIEDKNGVMVEISSLTEKEVNALNDWHDAMLVSPREAMIGFMATDPHAEEVERSKELGAKYEKIQNKMLAGKKLTDKEKSFLRENYPELAMKAEQMEQEAEQLKKRLQSSQSPEDAERIYTEAKMNVMSGMNQKDGADLFLIAAIDNAYVEHKGRKSGLIDISA